MPTAGVSARLHRRPLRAHVRVLGILLAVPVLASSSAATAFDSSTATAFDEDLWPSSPSATFVGAGDIAYCNSDGDDKTAALLDEIEGTVFTLGDNSQNEGTHQQFRDCYDPSWGRHKWRTRPAIGNHERESPDAAGYFDYFGEAAGPWGRGYYSYDLGAWHIVVLDSNCELVGGCQAGSAQERWLRDDLVANPSRCTLAIWHHPLFNSGEVGNHPEVRDLWLALMDTNADVVLTGHDHHYERFARQDADGRRDPAGMRQFIVGTGGATFHRPGTRQPNSEVIRTYTLGLLRLELRPNSYTWEFVPTSEYTFRDGGWDACRSDRSPAAQR